MQSSLRLQNLVKNTAWNFLGQGLPLITALFAIPVLIEELGLEKFGTLTLIWAIVGYTSILDFGLGRALTQLLAKNLGGDDTRQNRVIVSTALLSMTALGLLSAIIVWLLAPWFTKSVLRPPLSDFEEVHVSMQLIALSLPFIITSTGLRGVLEAYQRFDLVNGIRLPLGLLSYLGPLLILFYSQRLDAIVLVLVSGRIVAAVAYYVFCRRLLPDLQLRRYSVYHLRSLLSFGSWMTISNIVSPLMLYLDRFFVAGLTSAAVVAYYTTPYEIVTRMWIVPGAILSVMFPNFSSEFTNNKERAALLYIQTQAAIISVLLLPVLGIIFFAEPGLALWLGPDFAENSVVIIRLLAVGVLVNSIAQGSAVLIQASGRPAITAKLHLAEIFPYITYLWLLVERYGMTGAALAWLTRVSISCVILLLFVCQIFRKRRIR